MPGQQREPVADGLPEGEGDGEVVGDRDLLGRGALAGVGLGLPNYLALAGTGGVNGNAKAKAAVDKGCAYLAAVQKDDGSFPADLGDTSAVVGLAVLAWLGAGSLPGEGPYGREVARSVEYLLRCQQPDGLIHRDGTGGKPRSASVSPV